ncbi:Zinc finger C2H2 protein [Dictyocoela muelleri]|nr:Zinc finger C2H2 protein [Dictyocoela muelleri]
MKRQFDSNRIDFNFLLKQQTLVTEWEYQSLGMVVKYQKYMSSFYNRRLHEIFDKEKNNHWFIDRYVNKVSEKNVDTNSIPHLIIENIPETFSYENLLEKLKETPHFKSINIVQKGIEDDFSRDLEIFIDDESYIDEAIEFIRQFDLNVKKASEFEFFEKKSVSYSSSDYQNIKKIAKMFFNGDFYNRELIKIDNHDVKGENNGNISVEHTFTSENDLKAIELANSFIVSDYEKEKTDFMYLNNYLRGKYNYCYYCVKKFDTKFQMLRNCGSSHIFGEEERDVFIRKINLMLQQKEIKITAFDENIELDKVICKRRDFFACDVCNKAFETSEYVKKHFKNKHSDQYQEIIKISSDYEKVMKNFDFLIFSIAEGLNLNYIPIFLEHLKLSAGKVKYIFDKWFSGEIKIKRSN